MNGKPDPALLDRLVGQALYFGEQEDAVLAGSNRSQGDNSP